MKEQSEVIRVRNPIPRSCECLRTYADMPRHYFCTIDKPIMKECVGECSRYKTRKR